MILTPEEVLERAEAMVEHAAHIQELKDSMTYLQMFGQDESHLSYEVDRYDRTMAEVRGVYDNDILPIVEELASFLEAHPSEVKAIVARRLG